MSDTSEDTSEADAEEFRDPHRSEEGVRVATLSLSDPLKPWREVVQWLKDRGGGDS